MRTAIGYSSSLALGASDMMGKLCVQRVRRWSCVYKGGEASQGGRDG